MPLLGTWLGCGPPRSQSGHLSAYRHWLHRHPRSDAGGSEIIRADFGHTNGKPARQKSHPARSNCLILDWLMPRTMIFSVAIMSVSVLLPVPGVGFISYFFHFRRLFAS